MLAVPSVASAQSEATDPLADATVRLGPLGFTPTLTLRDVGRDNNVFDDRENPKSDFTMTVTPKAVVLFRPRLVHLTYTTVTNYVYYRTYATERGTNEQSSLRADFQLARFQPFVGLQGANTRERYNQEVDVRARHHDTTYTAGVSLKIATRVKVTASARRNDLSFDEGTSFRGQELARTLDGRNDALGGSFGLDLTPFTTFSVDVSHEQERFRFSSDRDSDTLRVTPTIAFSPDAVLKGTASVGYRRMTPRSSTLPGFSGLVSAVTLGGVIQGRHRIDTTFTRDARYSYDATLPYYITTGGAATLTSEIAGPFDVQLTAGRQALAYRARGQSPVKAGTDTVTSYGAGAGYRLRDRVRIGLNADWQRRGSTIALDREYRNHRVFASLTWGAP